MLFGFEDWTVVLLDRTVIIYALHLDHLNRIFVGWTFMFRVCVELSERSVELQRFSWI